ncbi:hypothetical protein ABEB22_05675 [Thioclava sp. 'Guangxiensis']|uniref:hypothetical protein n=1 Tax=Thioclava sp. 'Guangxiensis' TaxID=3149044 RepID=UPI0038783CD6
MRKRKLTFHFEGSLADQHTMNFYEVARFQYAASRLLVKLDHFRRTGKVPDRITDTGNAAINVMPHSAGSFNIDVSDMCSDTEEKFIDAGLDELLSYLGERLVGKVDEDTLKNSTVKDMPVLSSQTSRSEVAIDDIAHALISKEISMSDVPDMLHDLLRKRVAEICRDQMLTKRSKMVSKIDESHEQKLVGMAAPLVKEMAVALRRSAETLEVVSHSNGKSNSIIYLDADMAKDIEAARVDQKITTLLCDVIQFNKDNGWGKVRIEGGTKTVSFSIPSDLLPKIKQQLIDTMKKDDVNLQAYIVRDRNQEIKRLIVAGIIKTPKV